MTRALCFTLADSYKMHQQTARAHQKAFEMYLSWSATIERAILRQLIPWEILRHLVQGAVVDQQMLVDLGIVARQEQERHLVVSIGEEKRKEDHQVVEVSAGR